MEKQKVVLKAAPSRAIEQAIEDCSFALEGARAASAAAEAAYKQANRALEKLHSVVIGVAGDGTFFEVEVGDAPEAGQQEQKDKAQEGKAK